MPSQIWNNLSHVQKRLTIIASIVSALLIIGKFSYDTITRAQDIQSTIEDIVRMKNDHSKLIRTVKRQRILIDSLIETQAQNDYQLEILEAISKSVLKNKYINGTRFKEASDSSLYFLEEGKIYPVFYDKNSNRYYYVNSQEKSFWCE